MTNDGGAQVEQVTPYGDQTTAKTEQVRQMFDAIAPAYDFMNRAMTLGIDIWWRRLAVKRLKRLQPATILDVATGTGDFAIQLNNSLHPQHVMGIDLSQGMLDDARRKVKGKGLERDITFEQGDCMALPMADESFDAVTVAFGVRNFEHLQQGYHEMARVLKPGGMLCVLELSTPTNRFIRWFYDLYTLHIIPWLGSLKSGEKSMDELVEMSVGLLKVIHSCEVDAGSLPDMKQVVLEWIEFDRDYLPADQYEKLKALVQAVPETNHLLHGDYHIKNVLVQNGECLLIDMDTLCYGHPIFEFASMYNDYCGYSYLDPEVSMNFYGVSHDEVVEFWRKSLALYLGTDDAARLDDVERKAMLIGFARILRRAVRKMDPCSEEQEQTMANARKQIAGILPLVDTLEF